MRDEQLYSQIRCQNVEMVLLPCFMICCITLPLCFLNYGNYYLIHQFISHFETTIWHLEAICGHIYDHSISGKAMQYFFN